MSRLAVLDACVLHPLPLCDTLLRLAESGIAARVTHAEYLGADTVVACVAGEGRLLARLPGRVALPDGAPVHFTADPADLHLFHAETGARIPEGVFA